MHTSPVLGFVAFITLTALWTIVDHLFGRAAGLRFWAVCLLVTAAVFTKTQRLPVTIGSRRTCHLEGDRKASVVGPMVVIGLTVVLFPDEVACTIRLRGYVCP